MRPSRRPARLWHLAISNASRTMSVPRRTAMRQPVIILEKASAIEQTYAMPARPPTCLRSVSHNRFGAVALKSRFTRSGASAASGC